MSFLECKQQQLLIKPPKIDENIFNWLISLEIIPKIGKLLPNEQIVLPKNASNYLANGILFAKLSLVLLKAMKLPLDTFYQLGSFKDSQDIQAKLFNWNIVCSAFKKLDIEIDQDVKSLIVAGDTELINPLLKEIRQRVIASQMRPEQPENKKIILKFKMKKQNEGKIQIDENDNYEEENDALGVPSMNFMQKPLQEDKFQINISQHSPIKSVQQNIQSLYFNLYKQKRQTQYGISQPSHINILNKQDSVSYAYSMLKVNQKLNNVPLVVNEKQSVNLNSLDIQNRDIKTTTTLIEFFITLLGQQLGLNSKQTATLFTSNGKHLANLIVKGQQKNFDKIILFFKESLLNISHIIQLLKSDDSQQTFSFTMNALKSGFLSQNYEVSNATCQLFQQLSFQFQGTILHEKAWNWFKSEYGGLECMILCLKRHPDLKDQLLLLMLQFGRLNFQQLLTNELMNKLKEPLDFLFVIMQIFENVAQSDATKDDFVKEGILENWHEYTITHANEEIHQINSTTRFNALKVLIQIWKFFPERIESDESQIQQIYNMIKKQSRETQNCDIINSFTICYQLLHYLIKKNSTHSVYTFKLLIFIMIENYQNITIRQICFSNFISIFNSKTLQQKMPVVVLLQPLLKVIQQNTEEDKKYNFHIFDFEFFLFMGLYQGTPELINIHILDQLAKIYFNDLIYAHVTIIIFKNLYFGSKLSGFVLIEIMKVNIKQHGIQDFIINFIKLGLAMYYSAEKTKYLNNQLPENLRISSSPYKYINSNENQDEDKFKNSPRRKKLELDLSVHNTNNEIFSKQKNALIIQIMIHIVNLNEQALNNQIKQLITHTNIQIRKFTKEDNKELLTILKLLGGVDTQCINYEVPHSQQQDKKSADRRKSRLSLSVQRSRRESNKSNIQILQQSQQLPQSTRKKSMNEEQQNSSIQQYSAKSEKQNVLPNNLRSPSSIASSNNYLKKSTSRSPKLNRLSSLTPSEKDELYKDLEKQYGIGLRKKNQSTETNFERFLKQLELLKRGKIKPSKEILEELASLKKKVDNKLIQKQKLQMENQQKSESQQIKLRKILEKRRILQGVSNFSLEEDQQIFPFDTQQAIIDQELKSQIKCRDYFFFEPVELELEEDHIVRDLNAYMKKYKKLFFFLFSKYSNSQSFKKQITTFQNLQNANQWLNLGELQKMFIDHDITQAILPQNQLKTIMKETQLYYIRHMQEKKQKLIDKKHVLTECSFNEFRQIFQQVAFFIFGVNDAIIKHQKMNFEINQPQIFRQQQNYINKLQKQVLGKQSKNQFSLKEAVEKLVLIFKKAECAQNEGICNQLYDDPHKTTLEDEEVIKELNQKLAIEPDFEIPEKFQKVQHIEFSLQKMLPLGLLKQIGGEKFEVAYSVVNEAIEQALNGICLYEQISIEKKYYMIKPKIILPLNHIQQLPKEHYMEPVEQKLKPDTEKEVNEKEKLMGVIKHWTAITKNQKISSEKKRLMNLNHYRPLSFTIKMLIANSEQKDRYMFQEVGEVLEDLLEAVSQGKKTVNYGQGMVINRDNLSKQFKDQQISQIYKWKSEEESFREHDKKVKQNLQKQKELQTQNKEKLESEKLEKEKIKAEEEGKQKEKNKQKWEKIKQNVKQFKEKKNQDQEKKQQEKNQNENEEQKGQKKYDSKSKSKVKQQVQKIQKDFKVKNEKKNQKEKEKLEKEKKQLQNYNQKLLPKLLSNDHKIQEVKQQLETLINKQFESEDIKWFFKFYSSHFNHLFKFLIDNAFTPLNLKGNRKTLIQEQLLWFTIKFDVCPYLSPQSDIMSLYKHYTKKNTVTDQIKQGLSFDQFLLILFRVTIIGNDHFQIIGDKLKAFGIESILSKEESISNYTKQELMEMIHIEYLDSQKSIIDSQNQISGQNIDIVSLQSQIKSSQKSTDQLEKKSQISSQDEKLLKLDNQKKLEEFVEKEQQKILSTNKYSLLGLLYFLGFPFNPNSTKLLEARIKNVSNEKEYQNKLIKKQSKLQYISIIILSVIKIRINEKINFENLRLDYKQSTVHKTQNSTLLTTSTIKEDNQRVRALKQTQHQDQIIVEERSLFSDNIDISDKEQQNAIKVAQEKISSQNQISDQDISQIQKTNEFLNITENNI